MSNVSNIPNKCTTCSRKSRCKVYRKMYVTVWKNCPNWKPKLPKGGTE